MAETRSDKLAGLTMVRHGHTKGGATPTYMSWAHMLQRCTNPNNQDFKYYGGRGIRVCKRWKKFSNFLADMGAKIAGLTLDRIQNNKGYSKGNCRWITQAEQTRNSRQVRRLTFKGTTLPIGEWERRLGFSRGGITYRLSVGWPLSKALSEPPSGGQHNQKLSRKFKQKNVPPVKKGS